VGSYLTTSSIVFPYFPVKKFPENKKEKKGNPGISRLNREMFAISRNFPSREFPGTNTKPNCDN
jgi:hypothetical protein